MAGALRPVVLLMLLASLLFVVDGVLDGPPFAYASYFFAAVNAAIAVLIARGSERSLVGRIALSAFFLVERPVTAFALGPKSTEAIAVHAATAVVELVILLGALRVWRLGRSVAPDEMEAIFALEGPSPAPPLEEEHLAASAELARIRVAAQTGTRRSWTIGALTLLVAAILVADGVASGFVPGGRAWGIVGESSGWLVYLFALVALTVAVPAVHGGTVALRVLFALALIFFIERAFSPFALRTFDPVTLGLHVLAAFVSLALALASAGAIRGGGSSRAQLASAQAP
jgi:hypothetical protein